MTKLELITLLSQTIQIEKFLDSDEHIYNLTSNIQDTRENTIAFYNFRKLDKEYIDVFKKRLIKVPSLLITNRNISNFYKGDFIIVSDIDFIEAQRVLVEKVYPSVLGKVFGVTGTNGKTSVAFLSMNLSNILGHNSVYIGTLGIWKNGECIKEEINNTTPSFIELGRMIFENCNEGTRLFIEVSSHALEQDRLLNMHFNAVAWTNFTQDHLDYHLTMEKYFEAKLKIIKYLKPKAKIYFPTDQAKLINNVRDRDCSPSIAVDLTEAIYNIPEEFLDGFNKSNLELALSLNSDDFEKNKKYDLGRIKSPLGRFTKFFFKNNIIIVDYAHTPDALENVLKSVNNTYKGKKKIITIFGCGGDRDKTKRPLMGEIALRLSDITIVTSDNPRTEDPFDIIRDITQGESKFTVSENRKNTILKELAAADNTVILIAGKGHENYQDIMGVKNKYSDLETVKEFLSEV